MVTRYCLLLAIHLGLLSLSSQVTHPSAPSNASSANNDNWSIAVQKGTVLFQQLLSGCFPDQEHPISFEDLLAQGWLFGDAHDHSWPPAMEKPWGFSPYVRRIMEWADGEQYYIQSIRKGNDVSWRDCTNYWNIYSPNNGLIASLGSHKVPSEPVHWSDATFAVWSALNAASGTNIQNLNFIGQSDIFNAFTRSIIDRMLPRSKGKTFKVFHPKDEAFLALLGTPNGVGGVYLLMHHKQALGFKAITTALVFRDRTDSEAHLVFVVRSMTVDAGRKTDINNSLPLDGHNTLCRSTDGSLARSLMGNT